MNLRFLIEVVTIYNLLLQNGIDKNAQKMKELRLDVIKIQENIGNFIVLMN